MEQLLQAYRSRRLILFVGAGISMNLGLPSWRQLIDHVAEELGFDPEIYRTFGSEPTLAEYYRIQRGHIGSLRSWMDVQWHASSAAVAKSRVHELIATADFDLIYTTNYDRLLESAFDHHQRPFLKIASVGDCAKVTGDRTQIVKFHGDFDDDSSIVLDETSFFERMAFESPLDIKLRADVLGRSVLFIGYSLNDINIRYLFFKLSSLWKKAARGAVQPSSYFLSSRPNPIQEATLAQWNIQMISPTADDSSQAVIELLERLV